MKGSEVAAVDWEAADIEGCISKLQKDSPRIGISSALAMCCTRFQAKKRPLQGMQRAFAKVLLCSGVLREEADAGVRPGRHLSYDDGIWLSRRMQYVREVDERLLQQLVDVGRYIDECIRVPALCYQELARVGIDDEPITSISILVVHLVQRGLVLRHGESPEVWFAEANRSLFRRSCVACIDTAETLVRQLCNA